MYVCTARRSVIYPIIKGQVSGSDDDDDDGDDDEVIKMAGNDTIYHNIVCYRL